MTGALFDLVYFKLLKRPAINGETESMAGAIGNLIDRLRLGYVVDFLNFYVWPVFNVADSSITIGAILLAWAIYKRKA